MTVANMNAAGNELWLTTYNLSSSGQKLDPSNYELAMNSINDFIAAYKATSSPDAYLTGLYNLLNQTYTGGTSSCSLASLAANFAKNGYASADFTNYKLMAIDSTSPLSELENPANQFSIQNFGGDQGMYNSNPQMVAKAAIGNVLQDLSAVPPVPATIIADVKALTTELGLDKSSMDGLSQFMNDLLNTPIDPTNATPALAKATLASLSTSATGAADMQTILTGNPTAFSDFVSLGNQFFGMENWG